MLFIDELLLCDVGGISKPCTLWCERKLCKLLTVTRDALKEAKVAKRFRHLSFVRIPAEIKETDYRGMLRRRERGNITVSRV